MKPGKAVQAQVTGAGKECATAIVTSVPCPHLNSPFQKARVLDKLTLYSLINACPPAAASVDCGKLGLLRLTAPDLTVPNIWCMT